MSLVGFTSAPHVQENAVKCFEDGKVKRGYRGAGCVGHGCAEGPGGIVRGLSGKAVRIQKKPDLDIVKRDLQKLYTDGYHSHAIVLAHSYTFPMHETTVGSLHHLIRFTQVPESSQLLPMITMIPRRVSSTADAYITPILRQYLDGFDAKLRDGKVKTPRVE